MKGGVVTPTTPPWICPLTHYGIEGGAMVSWGAGEGGVICSPGTWRRVKYNCEQYTADTLSAKDWEKKENTNLQ